MSLPSNSNMNVESGARPEEIQARANRIVAQRGVRRALAVQQGALGIGTPNYSSLGYSPPQQDPNQLTGVAAPYQPAVMGQQLENGQWQVHQYVQPVRRSPEETFDIAMQRHMQILERLADSAENLGLLTTEMKKDVVEIPRKAVKMVDMTVWQTYNEKDDEDEYI